MVPITLADLSLHLKYDFSAAGAEADQARVLSWLDAAEDLVAAASTVNTPESLARTVTIDAVKRAWKADQSDDAGYSSFTKTVGGVTEGWSKPQASDGTSVYLTKAERGALRGSSSSRARSVALGGVGLRSVLSSEGG